VRALRLRAGKDIRILVPVLLWERFYKFRDSESLGLFIKIQSSASITRAIVDLRALHGDRRCNASMCRGATMVRELEQIGTTRNVLYVLVSLALRGRATDSSGAADKPAASVERSSTGMFCLTMYEVRCTRYERAGTTLRHALMLGRSGMRCPVGDTPRGTWVG